MATDDRKYQAVRDETKGEQGCPSQGEWIAVIHDCFTPSIQEIEAKNAAVGTTWRCGSCEDIWKLGTHTPAKNSGFSVGVKPTVLQWIRITPKPGNDQE